jgi:hypothetical protein
MKMRNHEKTSLEFADALGETDFGLIICSKTGRLKGLWIPEGQDEDNVPQTIVDVCVDYFGVDPNEKEMLH